MDAAPTSSGTSQRPIVIAIVAAAVVIAGAIIYVSQEPSECEQWNEQVRTVLRRIDALQNAAPGTVTPEETSEVQSALRDLQANAPDDEDCVTDERTDELSREVLIE